MSARWESNSLFLLMAVVTLMGWIESSIFSGQILANEQQEYKYEQLKEFLAGIHYETI